MIIILDEQYNEVEIIPTCFSDAEAIAAAKKAVHEAALAGKTFTVVNEDGEFLFRAVSIYTAITVAIGCPDTLAIVRHLGSLGMSCHNRSHVLVITPLYALLRAI